MVAGTVTFATSMGSALLKPKLRPIRWIVNWVITGVASVLGGVAIFWLALTVRMPPQSIPPAWSESTFEVAMFLILSWLGPSLYFGMVIAVESRRGGSGAGPTRALGPLASSPPDT